MNRITWALIAASAAVVCVIAWTIFDTPWGALNG
jgi:hypothetical protein